MKLSDVWIKRDEVASLEVGGFVVLSVSRQFSGGADEIGLRRKSLVGGGFEVMRDACPRS